jgi:hypothetical protein
LRRKDRIAFVLRKLVAMPGDPIPCRVRRQEIGDHGGEAASFPQVGDNAVIAEAIRKQGYGLPPLKGCKVRLAALLGL